MFTEPPQSEYRYAKRNAVLLFGLAVAISGTVVILLSASRHISPKPGDDPGVHVVGIVGGILMVLFGLPTAACAPKLGRLRLYRSHAELPRLGLAPWCLFGPRQILFSDVQRWGVATVELDTPQKLLVFEVQVGTRRIEKLLLSNYPDPQAVLEDFSRRLPPPSRVEVGANFGGVQFLN